MLAGPIIAAMFLTIIGGFSHAVATGPDDARTLQPVRRARRVATGVLVCLGLTVVSCRILAGATWTPDASVAFDQYVAFTLCGGIAGATFGWFWIGGAAEHD